MTAESERHILITGGAGFIGSNLAARLLTSTGAHVHVFDNFARSGVEHNVDWLSSIAATPSRLQVTDGDVRNYEMVRRAARNATEIYHFAAQVAVTTSIADPGEDCDINVRGTLNVLEAARASSRNPFLLYTSTNKVYGALGQLAIESRGQRYCFSEPGCRGVAEDTPLDLYSPYGCSKGSADQYVRDYARIYKLPTVVFRMSCIAGPRQFGNEDQGWVAHFLYSALNSQPITIYGDGLQVRDVLHVHDLIDAMGLAREKAATTAGEIYNVGGGQERSVSVLQILAQIRQQVGRDVYWKHDRVRPGDQPIYITDHSKLSRHTGWNPRRSLDDILSDIHAFWTDNQDFFRRRAMEAETCAPEAVSSREKLA